VVAELRPQLCTTLLCRALLPKSIGSNTEIIDDNRHSPLPRYLRYVVKGQQGMVRMKFRSLIVAACVILPVTLNAEQVAPSTGPRNDASIAKAAPKTLSAAIEEVVASEDAGYQAIAYVVRWHGARVVVVDPLARSRLSVGDTLNFFASHHDVADNRLLSFVFMGQGCKCDDKSGRPAATRDGNSAAKTAVGLVEEVLSAQEDGYRFVAYIVQAQGSRIAVSDPLAQSHHVVGEDISFLAMSNSAAGNPVMTFLAMPSDNPAQVPHQSAATKSEQTGIIEEVLRANADGFGYTAYILNSLGTRVAIEDVPGATPHRVGDQISFVSQRIASPKSSGPGILRFEPLAPEAGKQENVNLSITQETATVAEVLTLQADGYRYVAYVVNWHGARVAVSDAFSSTHYAVGDQITFPASRATSPSGRQLSFLLFSFDKSAMSQQQAK
jgi:hypothetical protein